MGKFHLAPTCLNFCGGGSYRRPPHRQWHSQSWLCRSALNVKRPPTVGERMKKDLTRQQYLDLYYYMRLNRAVEDTMVKLFRQNKIVGGLYSSLGQEAISVGSAYALEKRDWLAPMIRNIGALLVKGVPPRDIFMQHMAKDHC